MHKQLSALSPYYIFSDDIRKIDLESRFLINTINQYSFLLAENDVIFKEALANSDILLPDGIGITFAARFLTRNRLKKITGADIHAHCLKQVEEKKGTVLYVGSTTETMLKVSERITWEYPAIKHVGFICPPYCDTLDLATNELIINKINSFKPDVLFVALGAPKQEKWVFINEHRLNTQTICCIGAAIDFFANYNRPNKILIYLGLEWLVRLWREPYRMANRYLIGGPVFFAKLLTRKLKRK